MMRRLKFAGRLSRFGVDERGVAAIEFSLIAIFLGVGVLNATDVAVYLVDRLQVENAAEMGAQAAWKACDLNHLPATTNCSGLSTAVTSAVQSTTLGNRVHIASDSPSEGYYCVNVSGALQYMSGTSSKPSDCAAAGTTNSPADYISVQTTYTYTPTFAGLSVGSLLTTPIVRTAWMRLG